MFLKMEEFARLQKQMEDDKFAKSCSRGDCGEKVYEAHLKKFYPGQVDKKPSDMSWRNYYLKVYYFAAKTRELCHDIHEKKLDMNKPYVEVLDNLSNESREFLKMKNVSGLLNPSLTVKDLCVMLKRNFSVISDIKY